MKENTVYKNGILHCAECGGIREKEIYLPAFDGTERREKRKFPCMCQCQRERLERVEKRMQFEEGQRRVISLRQMSLMDKRLKQADFTEYQVTDENRKAFGIAKRYVENFELMFSSGQGILFWGGVGTGKSYTAAAIANELLNQMYPVVMTSFIKLLDEMNGFEKDNSGYVASLNQAKLLVIDDLGAERGTDYALEKVYDVIDSRYRSRRPVILTTNLEFSQMKSCTDIRYSRIYDRIFEMCYPVKMSGLSWRKREAAARFAGTKKILEG